MKPVSLHDKKEIEAFLRQNEPLHIYEIGDLDDFFWQYTSWYAFKRESVLTQLVLLYLGFAPPTLLALTEAVDDRMPNLLEAILSFLPEKFYAHLSNNLAAALTDRYRFQFHGTYYKMVLRDYSRLKAVDTRATISLSTLDRARLEAFYQESYPGNWFDSRMLETGQYFGVRQEGKLASVAGIHVYSPRYKVAALGNIATHPAFRGRGLATVVTARLCQELLERVDTIGLNVKADNGSAIACYEKLGFKQVAEYGEYSFALKKEQN